MKTIYVHWCRDYLNCFVQIPVATKNLCQKNGAALIRALFNFIIGQKLWHWKMFSIGQLSLNLGNSSSSAEVMSSLLLVISFRFDLFGPENCHLIFYNFFRYYMIFLQMKFNILRGILKNVHIHFLCVHTKSCWYVYCSCIFCFLPFFYYEY